jgi:hypothetical protein
MGNFAMWNLQQRVCSGFSPDSLLGPASGHLHQFGCKGTAFFRNDKIFCKKNDFFLHISKNSCNFAPEK